MTDATAPENTTPDSTPVGNGTAPEQAPVTTPASLMDSIPDDLKSEASLANIKDVPTLVKSYVNAQRMIGNSVRIPGEDASAEAKAEFIAKLATVPGVTKLPDPANKAEMDAFYTKLGRPQTPSDYYTPESDIVDKNVLDAFKTKAHEIGLTKDQAKALTEFQLSQAQQVYDKRLADRENTITVLKDTWGQDYDNRLQAAKSLNAHYSALYPEAANELMNGPTGNNPVLLLMAAELGKAYEESGIIKGQPKLTYGLTSEEARATIKEIRANPQHAYHNPRDPAHAAAQEKMANLYTAAYPNTETQ